MIENLQGVKRSIGSFLQDPIARILLENSSLTHAQFETFLIQSIGSELANKSLSGEERAHLREKEVKISRGAFNRTLRQARTNVVRSLYTIFLLGYVGLFDTPQLEPFIEAASRIRAYTTIRTAQTNLTQAEMEVPRMIMRDLQRTLKTLARYRIDEV